MYKLNKHPHYLYLKPYFKDIVFKNFDDFNKSIVLIAQAESEKIGPNNRMYYEKIWTEANAEQVKHDIKVKVLGDCLEIFAAFFLQYYSVHAHNKGLGAFGLTKGSYGFFSDIDDMGCDGVGNFEATDDPAFIQVKYRSNPNDYPFNKSVFDALHSSAIRMNKLSKGKYRSLDPNSENSRLIFFTNIPLVKNKVMTTQFVKCKESCDNAVIVLGKNEIESLCGDKKTTDVKFWETFKEQFNTTTKNKG